MNGRWLAPIVRTKRLSNRPASVRAAFIIVAGWRFQIIATLSPTLMRSVWLKRKAAIAKGSRPTTSSPIQNEAYPSRCAFLMVAAASAALRFSTGQTTPILSASITLTVAVDECSAGRSIRVTPRLLPTADLFPNTTVRPNLGRLAAGRHLQWSRVLLLLTTGTSALYTNRNDLKVSRWNRRRNGATVPRHL